MNPSPLRTGLWDAITSLKLTITCLALLMVLVVSCTLAQVRLGTMGAVDLYMRSWFVWLHAGALSVPIFPAGALVGLVLAVNLVAAQGRRLELSWRKAGLWIVHAGLILLVVGEFVTGGFQVDGRMAIEEGQTANYVEIPRQVELAIVDTTDPAFDDVYGISEAALGRGGVVAVKGTPLSVRIVRYERNVQFVRRPPALQPIATQGVGTDVAVVPLPPVTSDEQEDQSAAVVEVLAGGGRSLGTWLASNAIQASQKFEHEGRTFTIALRPRREYLPYSLTLQKFRHDVYAGTTIPKNFSSLVRLQNPARSENREVLIYMNQPLRYDGKAFYQASFGKNDTLSILQVVSNPGWILPYLSTVLVTLGLLVHFGISLRRGVRRAASSKEA